MIILHVVLAEFGLTQRFDHVLHFLGGAAIAYFFFRVVNLFALCPAAPRWLHYLVSFTLSCTIAVFWEFAEFASDVFLHTSVQQGLAETMLDLVFGVLGAVSSLASLAFFRAFMRGA